jgi:hypothetical protein
MYCLTLTGSTATYVARCAGNSKHMGSGMHEAANAHYNARSTQCKSSSPLTLNFYTHSRSCRVSTLYNM